MAGSYGRRFLLPFGVLAAVLLLTAATGRGAEPGDAGQLLQAAQLALAEGNWEEAAHALAAAEQLPVSADLQRRFALVRRDLFTVVRLNELRDYLPVDPKKDDLDTDALLVAYRQVFHEYGLEPETEAADEMKERGRSSPIRLQLLAGLDKWARMAGEGSERDHLLAFADALDDSASRREVRAAVRAADFPGLKRLALQADVEALSPAILLLLVNELEDRESSAVLQLLRRGQHCFPGDWCTQFALATKLVQQKPPQAEEALSYWLTVVSVHPDQAAGHAGLAFTYWLLDRYPEAEQAARTAVRLQPQWSQAQVMLTIALSAQARYTEAEVTGRKAVRLNPRICQAQYVLGLVLTKREKWPDAEAALRQAVAMNAEEQDAKGIRGEIHKALGIVCAAQQKVDEAEKLLREAVQYNPEDDEARLGLARVIVGREYYEEAETLLQELIRRNKDNLSAHALLATILFTQKKWEEMQTPCLEVLRLDPENLGGVGNAVGLALVSLKRYPEAEAVGWKVLESQNACNGTWMFLITSLLAQEKTSEAVQASEMAVSRLPDDTLMNSLRVFLLKQQGRLGEAETLLRKAVQRNQDKEDLRKCFVEFLKEQQREKEAETLFQEQDAAVQEATAHCDAAWDLQRAGRYQEAINHLCWASALNPKLDVWKRFVDLYDLMDEPELAIAEYQRELAAKPTDADLLTELAERLSRIGELAQSEQYLRQAVVADASSERAWVNLGTLLAAQGRLDESLDALQHTMRSEMAYCNIAAVQAAQGKRAEAIKMYRNALEVAPDYQPARTALEQMEKEQPAPTAASAH